MTSEPNQPDSQAPQEPTAQPDPQPTGESASQDATSAESTQSQAQPETPARSPIADAIHTIAEGVGVPVPDAVDDIDQAVQRELAAAVGGIEALVEKSLAPEATPEAESAEGEGDQAKGSKEVRHKMVRGRISAIRGEDVFIDVTGGLSQDGAKLQGVVPLSQFERPPRMGSIMDFVVDKIDDKQGLVFLSREGAISLSTWDQLTQGSLVEARVTKSNKGGLELEMVGGIKAFMPASQIDNHHVEDLEQFVGQKIEGVVQEIDRKGKKVLLSRRAYLEKRAARNREKLLKEIEVGQEREGVVSSVMDFGCFVDLGGVDGLVHVTDMSHAHIDKPADVVKVGDKVTVKVLKMEEASVNSKGKPSATGQGTKLRIALGMKQIQPDPWEGVDNKYTAGEQVSARVTRTASFGAFIEVEPGVEGLLPISEMSWKRIHNAEEVVKVGDVIRLAILKVEPEKKRLTLSLKAAKGDPWVGATVKYAKDAMIEGTVTSTTDYGAFVQLEEGVEGLVHISELSTKRVGQVTDVIKTGDTQQFRVKEVDEDKRKISLSLKPAGEEGHGGRGEQPVVKGPARKRIPKENLKSGLGDIGSTGLGGLSLDNFK